MRIVLVEDDHLQTDHVSTELKRLLGADVHCIRTEQEFREQLDDIAARPPDVLVIDVMLRWADPSPGVEEPPPDVREGGFQKAGLRCQKFLATRPQTAKLPVILYSVLEGGDLRGSVNDAGVAYVTKDANVENLVGAIRGCMKIRIDSVD